MKWKRAEGSIYRLFADNPDKYLLKEKICNFREINIGVDFGGNKSNHTFVATGITHNYKEVIVLVSEMHKATVDGEELSELFVSFVKRVTELHGYVTAAYCDSAEQVLIRSFKTATRRHRLSIIVKNASKIEIVDRIRLISALISQERFTYTDNALSVRDAISEAVWDETKQDTVRLDDGTSDIDTLDALEYSLEKNIKRLLRE